MTKDYGSFKIMFPGERPEGGILLDFIVLEEGKTETKSFASYLDATEWIEKKESTRKKTARKVLDLPVISQKGKRCTITGIHAGHGKTLTKPDVSESYGSNMLLPNVPCSARTRRKKHKE